ncbi:MAG: extracellular solute-binding protein [Bacilli bacterium]|nr:extracellular solute-binding protein [Bacilli bacterium]
MKKSALVFAASALLAMGALTSCGPKADVVLTVYNWADYIYEGLDEKDNKVDDSTVESFEKAYFEETGKTIKVVYKTFSTCEDMYSQISNGLVKADLCCPSDYMIQKMQSEGMLESFGYNKTSKKYTEGLDNVNDNLSPYIKDLFNDNNFSDFAVPYFWGTMGYTYNTKYVTKEQVSTWDFQWNPGNAINGASLKKKITLKDSVRDTYFTGVMHVYKDELMTLKAQHDAEILSDKEYNDALAEIFNRHDATTLAAVERALIATKDNVTLEVDEGKNEMVLENILVNLAWSGDSVFSMDEAEEDDVILAYEVPVEGSNVWFDGWCMPKGANVEAAKAFVNFLNDPEVAVNNMDAVGYTSAVAGEAIWDYVNECYAAEDDAEEGDVDEVDLSYFFGDTVKDEAVISVPKADRGRQFDAQYPSEDVITRCAIMKDFGAEGNAALYTMWNNFKASF